MDKGRLYKILAVNGLKPDSFTKMDDDGVFYASQDGKDYKFVNGKKYEIITTQPVDLSLEKAKHSLYDLMKEFKDEISYDEHDIKNIDIHEGIVFINNETTNLTLEEYEVWKPIAGKHNGLITRTQEEIDRIKAIKKPRGWHFRDEFIDSEGNLYIKGVLQ